MNLKSARCRTNSGFTFLGIGCYPFAMRYRFGSHVFDALRFELLCEDAPVALRPRALSLLQVLLEHRERLVTKEELVETVWRGLAVSDSAITVTVRALRNALGRDGAAIETVYGKGLRFCVPVTLESWAVVEGGTSSDGDGPSAIRIGRPSIAVLPFRLIGIAGPHTLLTEALPDDIITSLTQLRSLVVIARGSTFRFPSYDFRLAAVGQELRVRYCLSGTMEIIGERLHLSLELGETQGESVIWRESFETTLRRAHELREEIVYRVANELDRRITSHEIELARLANPDSIDAWGLYHRGSAKVYSHGAWDLDGALADFSRSVALEPTFARAYGRLVHTHWMRTLQGPLEDRPAEVMAMLGAAEQAEMLDPLDPVVLTSVGRAKWMTGQVELARQRFERALELAPSFAQAYASLGGLHVLLGEAEEAQRVNSTAIALSPLDPNMHVWLGTQIAALIQLERYAEAADFADRAVASSKAMISTLAIALIAYDRADRTEAGSRLASQISRRFPNVSASEVGTKFPMIRAHTESVSEAFGKFGLASA